MSKKIVTKSDKSVIMLQILRVEMSEMNELYEWLDEIQDDRQQAKVRHKLKDIILIVLFSTLGNADGWEEIEDFAHDYEEYLRKYLQLPNGIPSHDTIQRVMAMINPEQLQQLQVRWQELLNRDEGEKLKKIICIDGKTMRSNSRKGSKPNHIVSAWCKEDGYCLGQKSVEEKSNEITAIPEVLDKINIQGQIVTIDAMGTQTAIAEKIRSKRADYVLALKGNQGILNEDVRLYFEDADIVCQIQDAGNYKKTIEKAHGQIEIREYFQTDNIHWLSQKSKWKGLKSFIMERTTIKREENEIKECRYFISSLPLDIITVCRAVRGHWAIESMHWHLDVTFREDANTTLNKMSAQNLNIIRKWCLCILKQLEIRGKKMSLQRKRFNVSMNPMKHLEEILKL